MIIGLNKMFIIYSLVKDENIIRFWVINLSVSHFSDVQNGGVVMGVQINLKNVFQIFETAWEKINFGFVSNWTTYYIYDYAQHFLFALKSNRILSAFKTNGKLKVQSYRVLSNGLNDHLKELDLKLHEFLWTLYTQRDISEIS